MLFTGHSNVRKGAICIIKDTKELKKYDKLYYKLWMAPIKSKEAKSLRHTAEYKGFKAHRHMFEVESGDSDNKYTVDVRLGCSCKHAGAKGIASGEICSHELAALRKIVEEVVR